MKNISMIAIASAAALSALAFATTPETAKAGPIVPPGHYCMTYDEGGSDCSFTSYAQCQAAASGIDGECYGDTLRDDQASRNRGSAGEHQAPGF
jgi:Protein of unknown function (DUF3551)